MQKLFDHVSTSLQEAYSKKKATLPQRKIATDRRLIKGTRTRKSIYLYYCKQGLQLRRNQINPYSPSISAIRSNTAFTNRRSTIIFKPGKRI